MSDPCVDVLCEYMIEHRERYDGNTRHTKRILDDIHLEHKKINKLLHEAKTTLGGSGEARAPWAQRFAAVLNVYVTGMETLLCMVMTIICIAVYTSSPWLWPTVPLMFAMIVFKGWLTVGAVDNLKTVEESLAFIGGKSKFKKSRRNVAY